MQTGDIIDSVPTEYHNHVHMVVLIPGQAVQFRLQADNAPVEGVLEAVQWRFLCDLGVVSMSFGAIQDLVCIGHTSPWFHPNKWQTLSLSAPLRPAKIRFQFLYHGPAGVQPNLEVITDASMTLAVHRQAPVDGAGVARVPAAPILQAIPRAEDKPINQKRLATFDKEFSASRFKLIAPDGTTYDLDSKTFSRRYLASVTLGDCRNTDVHDLRSPGNPGWQFQKHG